MITVKSGNILIQTCSNGKTTASLTKQSLNDAVHNNKNGGVKKLSFFTPPFDFILIKAFTQQLSTYLKAHQQRRLQGKAALLILRRQKGRTRRFRLRISGLNFPKRGYCRRYFYRIPKGKIRQERKE
jgi:hypothetical protein